MRIRVGVGERADQGLDLGPGDAARAEQPRRPLQQSHDRGLDADRAGTAVKRDGGRRAGFGERIGMGRWARAAGAVRRRGDDGAAEAPQKLTRDGVRRRADRNGVEPGARQVANGGPVLDRGDERQRPGPERLGQLKAARVETREALRRREIADMRDERIETRAALGFEQARDGGRVARVGGEAVDGFRRQDDELAGVERRSGRIERVQGVRCAVSATITVTCVATTSGVLHLPWPIPNAVRFSTS